MNTGNALTVTFLNPKRLKPHEEHDSDHAKLLEKSIKESVAWTTPIVVESSENIILDGHHRYAAALSMGLDFLPCFVVDYDDEGISLDSWKPRVTVDRKAVRDAALTGELMEKKTSRHRFIDALPKVNIPLESLLLEV